ncbi:MAG: hypothetical protein ACJ72O_11045 [Marmoricola sp.]
MVSYTPTSPGTREDQRLYTEARLVEVACLDCLATVKVKKNSEQHTAIQWNAESLAHCAEFAKAASQPEGRPIRVACSRLRSSIEAAVKDGTIEIGAEDGY